MVVGASGLMVAGFLTTLLSPLLAVSFAREFDFGIQQAGLLVAAGQGGVALSAFGVLPFLAHLDRRRVGVAGATAAAACLALTGFATGPGAVLALQIGMGLGAGLCYACANSSLAYARFPERAFSIVTIAWMLVGAGLLALGPTLHDIWPKAGIYLGMATAELVCLVFVVRLPDVRRLPEKNDAVDPPSAERGSCGVPFDEVDDARPATRGTLGPAALLVAALWLLEAGNVMIWTFAESMGEAAGLTPQFNSTFLGVVQLIGLVGAAITMAFGARTEKLLIIAPAVVMLGVGNLLAGIATRPAQFIVGLLLINLAFFCVTPMLLALAAELDTYSGRLVVVAGGAGLVAGAVAPALGGWIAGADGHWARLGIIALILVSVSLPLLVLPVRAAKRRAVLTSVRTGAP